MTASPLTDSTALARRLARIAERMKAEEIQILDLRGLTSFTDCFVVCQGNSNRHVAAIADEIRRELKQERILPLGVEGEDSAQWLLLDYGEVVAHVLLPEARLYYQIEKLWADAPRLEYADPA